MEILTQDQYKTAGFNDDEIRAFTLKTTEENPNTSKEINPPPLIDVKPMQEYWKNIMSKANKYSENPKQLIKDLPEAIYGEKSEFIEHIATGLGATNWGLGAALLKGEDLPTAYQRQYGEDESFLEGLVQRGTTLAFNLPFYIGGAVVGGAAGAYVGGPAAAKITGPFGAGFVNGSIRKTLMEAIQKKQIDEPIDYMKIFLEEGVKEGLKEGTQLAAALNAPRLLGRNLGANYFAKVLARFSAFEGLGAAMHGQLAGGRELAYSGIFWGLSGFDGSPARVIRAEKHFKNKADEIYIQTNKKPTEVLIEENLDRTIKNDNDSITTVIPRAFQNLIDKFAQDPNKVESPGSFTPVAQTAKNITPKIKTIEENIVKLKKKNQEIYKLEREKNNKDNKVSSKIYKETVLEVRKDNPDATVADINRAVAEKLSTRTNKKLEPILSQIKKLENELDGVVNKKTEFAKPEQLKSEDFVKPEQLKSEDPSMQHMFDNMVFDQPKVKTSLMDKIKNARHRFEVTQIDFRSPVKRAMIEASMGVKPIIADLNVYEQSLQLSRARNLGDFFLLRKTLNGKGEVNGESLSDIFHNISKKDLQEYSAYELAVFNKTLTKRGLKTPFENKFTEQVVSNKNYIKKYEPIRKRAILFRERVINYVAEKGRLSAEQIKIIKEYNENYVPVFRELKNFQGEPISGKGSSLKKRNKEGSTLKILDTLESTVENTQRLIQEAEVNNLRVRFIEDVVLPQKAKKNPYFDFIQQMPMKQRTVKEIKENLLRDEVYSKEQLNLLSDKAINQLDAYRPNNYIQEGVFTIYLKNGEKQRWNVGEDLVTATSSGLSTRFDYLQRFANPAARLTRGGALFVPGFVVKNLFKDSLLAITSVPGTWIPLVDSAIGLMNIFRAKSPKQFGQKEIKELYLKWEGSLGPQSALLKSDTMLKDLPVHKLLNEAKLKNKIKDPWELVVKGTLSLSEEATRFRIFEKVYKLGLKKGLTEEQAMRRGSFSAVDLLDYGRMGTQGAYINSLVPFWNVSAQGVRKIYVTLKDNPKKSLSTIFLSIVLPTIYEQILYGDDPEYQKLESFIKQTNWYARVNGIEWKIPKPFQMGTIFSALTVSVMNLMKKEHPKDYHDTINALIGEAKAFLPIPQVFKPFVEIARNKTFFTGRNVIPKYLDRSIEDPYQAVTYTSETMKLIARGINSILPDNVSAIINNPMQLDHLVRSYIATLGKHLLTLTDKLLIETGTIEDPQKMSSELSDLPLARAFVLPKVPKWSSYESRYFKELDIIKKRDATIKFLEKNNEFEEAAQLKEKYPFDLAALERNEKSYQDITKAIIKISNAKLEFLLDDPKQYKTLTKEQKAEKIQDHKDQKFEQVRKLRTLQILITAQGLNMMNIKVAIPEDK